MENLLDKEKQIAQFMGLVTLDRKFASGKKIEVKEGVFVDYDAVGEGWLKYSTDYSRLMEVVEKIEEHSYSVGRHFFLRVGQSSLGFEIDRMNYKPFSVWGTSANSLRKVSIFKACADFVEWHSKQKWTKNKVLKTF